VPVQYISISGKSKWRAVGILPVHFSCASSLEPTKIVRLLASLVGCPRNKLIFFLGLNRNKPKLNLFRLIFGLFRETKNIFFGLFWCFEPVSKQPKQTDLFRNKPKKTKIEILAIKLQCYGNAMITLQYYDNRRRCHVFVVIMSSWYYDNILS
jgi:hypothetical protein